MKMELSSQRREHGQHCRRDVTCKPAIVAEASPVI